MNLQHFVKLINTTTLTDTLVENIEEAIANEIVAKGYSVKSARSSLWNPIATAIVTRAEQERETSNFLLSLVNNAITSTEKYMATNLAMECLRIGVISSSQLFDWPRYRAALLLYDPFTTGIVIPEYGELNRLLLDMNIELLEIEEEENSIKDMTIVQSIPGLGNLVTSKRFPLTDVTGLAEFISAATNTKVSPPSNHDTSSDGTTILPFERDEWLDGIANKLQIRIMVINLWSNMQSGAPLIKHRVSAIKANTQTEAEILTEQLINDTYPFESFKGEVQLSEKDKVPYLLYGTKGIMLVLLDYRYGKDRYLPLLYGKTGLALQPSVEPFSLWQLSPLAPSRDLGILSTLQHIRFVIIHVMPNLLLDELQVYYPSIKVGDDYATVCNLLKETESIYFHGIKANRTTAVEQKMGRSSDALRHAIKNTTLLQLKRAIREEGESSFSPESNSFHLLAKIDLILQQFSLNERR